MVLRSSNIKQDEIKQSGNERQHHMFRQKTKLVDPKQMALYPLLNTAKHSPPHPRKLDYMTRNELQYVDQDPETGCGEASQDPCCCV